jgi:hypothetical protein
VLLSQLTFPQPRASPTPPNSIAVLNFSIFLPCLCPSLAALSPPSDTYTVIVSLSRVLQMARRCFPASAGGTNEKGLWAPHVGGIWTALVLQQRSLLASVHIQNRLRALEPWFSSVLDGVHPAVGQQCCVCGNRSRPMVGLQGLLQTRPPTPSLLCPIVLFFPCTPSSWSLICLGSMAPSCLEISK